MKMTILPVNDGRKNIAGNRLSISLTPGIFISCGRAFAMICLICFMMLYLLPSAVYASDREDASVTFKALSENRYQVNWTIPKSSGESYVRVYLSVSDHDSDAVSWELGGIQSGTSGYLSVDLPDIDPGFYHFMISITTMKGTISTAFSDEAFFYDNERSEAELDGVLIGRSEDSVYAVWNDDTAGTLYIYDALTKELLVKEENVTKPASAEIPKGHKDVCIGAAAYGQKGSGQFTPYEAYLKDIPDASGIFPDKDITNQREFSASPGEYDMRLFCNNDECRLRNEQFRADLREGENTLIAFVTDGSGNTAAAEKLLTLDTRAPVLSIEYPSTGMTTTSKAVFIQGYAEDGAAVTCDDEPAEMTGGCFSIRKELSYGGNIVRVQAEDAAGNTTAYTIDVTRSFWSGQNKLLILAGIAGIIGIAAEIYMLFIRQKKNKTQK